MTDMTDDSGDVDPDDVSRAVNRLGREGLAIDLVCTRERIAESVVLLHMCDEQEDMLRSLMDERRQSTRPVNDLERQDIQRAVIENVLE